MYVCMHACMSFLFICIYVYNYVVIRVIYIYIDSLLLRITVRLFFPEVPAAVNFANAPDIVLPDGPGALVVPSDGAPM